MVGVVLVFSGCQPKPSPAVPDEHDSEPNGASAPHETDSFSKRRELRSTDWFEDVAGELAIEFAYSNGREAKHYTILETVGGGLGWVDFDLDGQIDLYCNGGGTLDKQSAVPSGVPGAIFQNRGGEFVNRTTAAGLDGSIDYSHGTLITDVNSDGFPDLFVTCYGQSHLYINGGDGTFEDATRDSGLELNTWGTAAASGDVNGDGLLDLFLTAYVDWKPDPEEQCIRNRSDHENSNRDVCPPQRYAALPDHLYLNSGDGTFRDVSQEYGIRSDGKGLGVLASDWNLDGKLDFYVANDVVANHFYSKRNETGFVESAEISGIGLNAVGSPEGSMGLATADVDGDGWQDLSVTNFEMEDNSLYRNLSGHGFQHVTVPFGLAGQGRQLVGFGTGFADFDADSWPDFYVVNGHVLYQNGISPFRQSALLYRNDAGQRFVPVTNDAGNWFDVPHASRGGAVGDFDNDGALDFAISSLNEPVAILKNRRPIQNWVRLKMVGVQSPRMAIGAHVHVSSFGRECHQIVSSGSGFLSHSDERLHFALSADEVEIDVHVIWPSGIHESFPELQTARDHVIIEGYGQQEKEE